MNIECGAQTLTELEHAFKFNDAVLRHLIVAMNEAVVTPSPMMKEEKSRSLDRRRQGREGGAATGARGREARGRSRRRSPRPRRPEARTHCVPAINRFTLDATLASARRAATHARRHPGRSNARSITGRCSAKRAASARSNAKCTRWRSASRAGARSMRDRVGAPLRGIPRAPLPHRNERGAARDALRAD